MPGDTRTSKLGYAEHVCFPDDGRRHEIIDGEHFVDPAPSVYHQTVAKRFHHFLYTKIELAELGQVFFAPIDVQLSEHDIVQPDLIVILNRERSIATPSKIKGAPDLVVEIVSPSTSNNDRTLKRSLYEKSGVAEYWIADPFEQTLDQLILQDGTFQARAAGEELRLNILDDIVIRMSDIW